MRDSRSTTHRLGEWRLVVVNVQKCDVNFEFFGDGSKEEVALEVDSKWLLRLASDETGGLEGTRTG